MSRKSITTSLPRDFEPKKRNPISLGADSNVDNDYKRLLVGDSATALEFATDKVRISNKFEAENIFVNSITPGQIDAASDKGIVDFTYLGYPLAQIEVLSDLNAKLLIRSVFDDTDYDEFECDANGSLIIETHQGAADDGTTATITLKANRGITLNCNKNATDFTDAFNHIDFRNGVEVLGRIDLNTEDLFRIESIDDINVEIASQGTGVITLDADGGSVQIKDGGDSHFLFDCGSTRFRIYDDTSASDHFTMTVSANGATGLATVDNDGTAGHLTLNPNGELILTPVTEVKSDAPLKIKEAAAAVADTVAYGQMWVKTATPNELWFTNDAGNDIPISLQPFVMHSQFQDDIGTAQHYFPFNNLAEQSAAGAENIGFIAPFDMKVQKVVIKCSEDISGATFEVGFWAIADGTTTAHHHTNLQQNVDVTGGAAHTNAVADFTGTVNVGSGSGGGSNAIDAGEFATFSIQADTDVTSSSAEFWITIYCLADLTSTI